MDVRPIDANALNLNDLPGYYGASVREEDVQEWIESAPTLDYAPVKRGEWEDGAFENSKKCTSCGRYSSKIYTANSPIFDYVICPYCGALMSGGSANGL